MSSERRDGVESGIAIIAMTGRFPGAADLEAYWRNIRDGVTSVTFFSDQELQAAGVPAGLLAQPSYVKARGTVEEAELFDASFFGYSPSDALMMDPQQRLFLQSAWEVFERAGYDPRAYRGLVGVYAGATASSYVAQLYQGLDAAQLDPLAASIGNELPYLTSRVSYKLDLKGPSYPVQTACSTSLVAVHLACQGLLNSECDLAIAGGVSIRVPQVSGYRYQQDGIFSPDGRCRPFDARSQGTLFSNGIGLVLLKRLDEAIADRDVIHAVIRGSAINNDGSLRASFTAPGVAGQTTVVADALASAEVDPNTIGYVESHGTATPLGDAIEIQALTQAFGNGSAGRQYCAIGSVKANIGHLDAAAGIAGLIKTVLALEHRQLPPTPNFERPNPGIHFEHTPFYVNTRLVDWPRRGGAPRRAGVSAFGFGGTNAHVVLEEAPDQEPPSDSRLLQLLTVSAQTEQALDAATGRLIEHLQQHRNIDLADAAYTLKVGRRAFRHRRAIVCGSVDEAARLVESRDAGAVLTGRYEGPERSVVFRFADTAGPVAVDLELYEREAAFRDGVDQCVNDLRRIADLELEEVLFPTPGATSRDAAPPAPAAVRSAAFVVQYALARLWMSWGVQPAACTGQGIGAEVAACLSGRQPLAEALRRVSRAAARTAPPADVGDEADRDDPVVLEIPGAGCAGDAAPSFKSLVAALGSLWLSGARIDWSAFYARERRYRVPLPTYPFELRRYGVDRRPADRPAAQTTAQTTRGAVARRHDSVAEWFYAPVWKQAPLALPLAEKAPAGARGRWLVFESGEACVRALADGLERAGHDVIAVQAGDRFGRPTARRFTIDPRSAADYERLVEEIAEGDRFITGVVHAWGVCAAGDGLDPAACALDQDRVFGSVLLLVRALAGAGNPAPIRLNVITSGAQDVTGLEPLAPGRAAALGLRHVITQEHPHLFCKAVDLDAPELTRALDAEAPVVRQILRDVVEDSTAAVVAYRGATRWTPDYVPLTLSDAPAVPPRLRREGVYLITGGLGEIGLSMAEDLARTVRARLVLVGRTPLPPESDWEGYLASHGRPGDLTARRILRLMAIRQQGAEVLHVCADVSDRTAMADAVAAAERRFGRIDGVIHAAGLMGRDAFKPIVETDRDRWRRQFQPKLEGLVVLDEVVRDRRLDFCLLVSSLSAVLGGLGYGAYASANAFLDAAARLRSRTSAYPWISVNWDAWLRADEEAVLSRAGERPSGYVMTASEGLEALRRILSADAGPQIVVSTGALHTRLEQWVALRPFRSASGAERTARGLVPRPALHTADLAADGGLERVIAEAFRQALGLDQVGVHDNFFELGGHSLKAIEVAARLQSELGAEVRVTTFYEAPTPALLARAIDPAAGPAGSFEDVDRRAENRLQRMKLRRRGAPAAAGLQGAIE